MCWHKTSIRVRMLIVMWWIHQIIYSGRHQLFLAMGVVSLIERAEVGGLTIVPLSADMRGCLRVALTVYSFAFLRLGYLQECLVLDERILLVTSCWIHLVFLFQQRFMQPTVPYSDKNACHCRNTIERDNYISRSTTPIGKHLAPPDTLISAT